MNPEFLRNAWIELTPPRLIAAPLVLGAIFLLAWYLNGRDLAAVSHWALWLYYFIVLMWGTRRAAASLADEVANRTWDSQRMSALSPWAMSWGKLLGGTLYVWYCALICLSVVAVESHVSWRVFLLNPIAGAVAMAVALLVVLQQRSRARLPGRRSSLIAQGLGVCAGVALSPAGPGLVGLTNPSSRYAVEWYGQSVAPDLFFLAASAGFLAWALFGVYRAMCADLQKPVWPWAWLAFSLYLIGFLGGFVEPAQNSFGADWLVIAVPAAAALFYVALFADGKDSVRYRWFLLSLGAGDWARALRLLPLWLPSLPVLAALALALGWRTDHGDPVQMRPPFYDLFKFADVTVVPATAWAVAAILFALRDLLLVLGLNFGTKSRSPDLAAFIYLAVLYWIIPGILGFVTPGWVQALFLPWPLDGPVVAICAPLAEVVLLSLLVGTRWRALAPRPQAA